MDTEKEIKKMKGRTVSEEIDMRFQKWKLCSDVHFKTLIEVDYRLERYICERVLEKIENEKVSA